MATNVATGIQTATDDERRRLRAQAASARRISGRGSLKASRRHARGHHRRRSGDGRPERHAAGGRHTRCRGHDVVAAARDGRRAARADIATTCTRAATRDEYGGPRDRRLHVPHAGVESIGRWGNVMGGQDFTTTCTSKAYVTNAVVQGEGRNLSFGVSVDAVDQFQVETSGTAVMFNGQGASTLSSSPGRTRSMERVKLLRNKALDAKSFFATSSWTTTSTNTAARSVDDRKNQMFFFVAYNGTQTAPDGVVLTSIPTTAERNGDFSALPSRSPIRERRVPIQRHGFLRDRFQTTSSRRIASRPISRYFQSFLPDPTNAGLQNNYLGSSCDWLQQREPDDEGGPEADTRQQFSCCSPWQAQSGDGIRGGTIFKRLCAAYTETRLVVESSDKRQVKHTYVLGSKWVNRRATGFSRLSVRFSTRRRWSISDQRRSAGTASW